MKNTTRLEILDMMVEEKIPKKRRNDVIERIMSCIVDNPEEIETGKSLICWVYFC